MGAMSEPLAGDNPAHPQLKLLTVGDGDFSASLAILRAYHNSNEGECVVETLTATTLLPSKRDVIQTYASSKDILEELESKYGDVVTILYGVDATKLHTNPALSSLKFDVFLFHHPHLGYLDKDHALRHSSLLAHYFYSAQQLLSERGYIHVCLCSGAIQSWKLYDIVAHLELRYSLGSPIAASRPLLEPLFQKQDTVEGQHPGKPSSAIKKCSRRGHWLGRYGYRHQPTFPQATKFQSNVSSSYHFFLQQGSDSQENFSRHCCGICQREFVDQDALEAHLEAPTV